MKIGDVAHVLAHPVKGSDSAFVVVGLRSDAVRLSYCGSKRWYVPQWFPTSIVSLAADEANRHVVRARRLLAAVKPDPDGWRRLHVGRDPNITVVVIGHQDLP